MPERNAAKVALAKVALESRERLVVAGESLSREPGNRVPLGRADIEQMVTGFLSVLDEALDGVSQSRRSQFVDAVFPSLVAAGEEPHRVLRLATKFHVLAACHLASHVGEAHRDEVIEWLSTFVGAYTADIARVIPEAAT